MKNLLNRFLSLIALSAIAFSYEGCQHLPQDDVNFNLTTDFLKAPTVIEFRNANSKGTALTNFNVTISGKDAGLVVTSDGTTTFKVNQGFLQLALRPGANPTPENPVIYTISAEVNGFAPITKTVIITENAPSKQTVTSVEYAHPAEGTSAIIQRTPLSNGVSGAVEIITPVTAEMDETAKINIQAGTQMLDANGNLITGNQLEIRVVFYGTETQASFQSFPGGFNAPDIIGEDGKPILGGGTFVTAGFIAIDMFVNGKEVKRFSKPIEITTQISNELINPETGKLLEQGEQIPVWSLNESTAQWKHESVAAITRDTNGKLVAKFAPTHLSYWNLDYLYNRINQSFDIKYKLSDPGYMGSFYTVFATANGQSLAETWDYDVYDGKIMTANGRPNMPLVKVIVYNMQRMKVGETALFNPRNINSIQVNVTTPPSGNMVNFRANIIGRCTNKNNMNVFVAGMLFYRKTTDAAWSYDFFSTTYDPKVRLEAGKTYQLQTFYNGKWSSTTTTIQKANLTLPTHAKIKGAGTYNASTNTLTLDATTYIECF